MSYCSICKSTFECPNGFKYCSNCRLKKSSYIKQIRKDIVVIDGKKKCINCLKVKDEACFNNYKTCIDCLVKVRAANSKRVSVIVIDSSKKLCSSCKLQKDSSVFITDISYITYTDISNVKQKIYKTCITCRNRIKVYRL